MKFIGCKPFILWEFKMEYRLGVIESKFADIIWNNEPLGSGELVKLAQNELEWKKSTTYTVLRKLCSRGIFRNVNGTVTSCISKEEFYAKQSKQYVEEEFGGSLPAFLAAFTSGKKLSKNEADEIRKMIDGMM